jgi:hypothetical protein
MGNADLEEEAAEHLAVALEKRKLNAGTTPSTHNAGQ